MDRVSVMEMTKRIADLNIRLQGDFDSADDVRCLCQFCGEGLVGSIAELLEHMEGHDK